MSLFWKDACTGSTGLMTAHTPDIGTSYSQFEIGPFLNSINYVDNEGASGGAEGVVLLTATPGNQNLDLQYTFKYPVIAGVDTNHSNGVVFYFDGTSPTYFLCDVANGLIRLFMVSAGTYTLLTSVGITVDTSDHIIKCTSRVSGSTATINVYLDGTIVITGQTASLTGFTGGEVGIRTFGTITPTVGPNTKNFASQVNTGAADGSNIFGGASLTAGTASTTSAGNTIATVAVTAASGGTSPYTYQWYRSTTSGFTPGGGNIVSGATSLTLNDTGLTNGTTYFYKNVVTDSASGTAISNQTSATPSASLIAGTATSSATGATTATVSVVAASGGTSPYTYQWYRSTTSGFTPGGGNIVAGATSLTLNDTGLTTGTTYFYKNVVTDNVSATAISNQVSVTPSASPTTLPAISNTAYIGLSAYQGQNNSGQDNAVFYNNPNLTSALIVRYPIVIPPNTTTSSPVIVSLSAAPFTNCVSPVFLGISDITTPGQTFGVGFATGVGIAIVGAGGFLAFPCGGSLPANLYLSNPNATESVVNIAVMTN